LEKRFYMCKWAVVVLSTCYFIGNFKAAMGFYPRVWQREVLHELWLRSGLSDPFTDYAPLPDKFLLGDLTFGENEGLRGVLKERLLTFSRLRDGFKIGFKSGAFSDTVRGVSFYPNSVVRFGKTELLWEPVARIGTDSLYPRYRKGGILGLDFDRAYLSEEFGNFFFLIGRERVLWEDSPYFPLSFSGVSPAFDMIFLSLRHEFQHVGKFHAQYGITQLDSYRDSSSETKRYLVFHRIDFSPGRALRVGFSEVVLFGGPARNLELFYLNPWIIYYPYQWNRGKIETDNFIWTFYGKVTSGKTAFYGTFLVDDYQLVPPPDSEPNHIGLSLLLESADPPLLKNCYLLISYQAMTRWALTYKNQWERFVYQRFPILHPVGPDFDQINLSIVWHRSSDLDLLLKIEKVRKGEGELWSPWPEGVFPEENFLSGIIEKRVKIEAGARLFKKYIMGGTSLFEFNLGMLHISNSDHLIDKNRNFLSISLNLALNW